MSLGPHSSVDIAQVLDFLANDARTQSIILYVEGIASARGFMSALRSAATAKPVVVLKAGRKPAGNEAAQTHSGAIVGSDDVFDAALRRAGAVRVRSFVELFSAAKCLASRYRPVGRRLAIVTNGGGPGVLAADWVNEIELQLGRLSPASAEALRPLLPSEASLVDLIDLSEFAGAAHYRAAVEAANRDPQVDGVLAICSPKHGIDPAEVAQALVALRPTMGKPLLACWMGDATVGKARDLLNEAAIPSFRTPEAAVGAFGNIASFYRNQQLLQQTPPPLSTLAKPDIEGARLVIESVLAERRKVLTEMESKTLLSAFHIPVTETLLARSANEAMMIATQLGFPVALKIDSPDISHKSDVLGVALNVMNGVGARDTYNDMVERVAKLQPKARINGVTIQRMASARRGREIHVGVVTDDPFGPVIVFGAGGTMIELIGDRAMELPPLNQFLARRLIERSRVAETLGEWRGAAAVDMQALEQTLLRVSEMVCELPQLREMDINPIIVDESGAVAVDARIVIDHPPHGMGGPMHGYQHLAILPYPARYERLWPLGGGGEGDGAADPPGRRADAQRARHRALAGKPLLPLRVVDARVAAGDARALHADRLRPRDGAGRRGAPACGRCERRHGRDRAHCRRVTLHHEPRPHELRVLAGGGRRPQRQGPRFAPDGKHHGRGPRQGLGRDRGPGAGRQRRDDPPDAQPRLHDQGLRRGPRLHRREPRTLSSGVRRLAAPRASRRP